MLDITDFIKPELLILVPVLYIVGLGLKKTSLSDKFIPLILGASGVILSAISGCLPPVKYSTNAVFLQ